MTSNAHWAFALFAGLISANALAAEDVTQETASVPAQNIDDLSLQDLLKVVISSTKTAQKINDVPAIVSVVTRDEIQHFGYRSVADLLTHTLGFYVVDDFSIPNVAVRGATSGLRSE